MTQSWTSEDVVLAYGVSMALVDYSVLKYILDLSPPTYCHRKVVCMWHVVQQFLLCWSKPSHTSFSLSYPVWAGSFVACGQLTPKSTRAYESESSLFSSVGSSSKVMFALLVPQGGTTEDDIIRGVASVSDGSVVLAGYTKGAWIGANDGSYDFAAVKLDAEGTEVWRWQVTTSLRVHP